MTKKINLLLCFCVFLSTTLTNIHSMQPRVLLVQLVNSLGGIRHNTVTLYKELRKINYPIDILIQKKSHIYSDLEQEQIPLETLDEGPDYNKCDNATTQNFLLRKLTNICKKNAIDIVHVNLPGCIYPTMLNVFKKLAKKTHVKILLQLHDYSKPDAHMFTNIHAITSTSPQIINFLKKENTRINIGIKNAEKNITFVPPIVTNQSFEDFTTKYKNKEDFLQNKLHLTNINAPIICMVANLNPCKNHALIIQAAHSLLTEKHIPVHLICAGGGWPKTLAELNQQISLLHLEDYVHLIGFCDEVPELLYYSDINVLPSSGEAFSIALIEAALMKKPSVVSDAVGSVNQLIFHEKTGLVFKSEDKLDLVEKILQLITHKEHAQKLGIAAYEQAHTQFSQQAILENYIHMYQQIA